MHIYLYPEYLWPSITIVAQKYKLSLLAVCLLAARSVIDWKGVNSREIKCVAYNHFIALETLLL